MTKDNWIKALQHVNPNCLGAKYCEPHSEDGEVYYTSKSVKKIISQVEKDAIEKTNKRWVERLAKFSRMGEISEKEVLQDFIKNKSDLLEDKETRL